MKKLTHIDETGKARMIDVGQKPGPARKAIASGFIKLQPETIKLISENRIKKGDVITIAEIAGVQAAGFARTIKGGILKPGDELEYIPRAVRITLIPDDAEKLIHIINKQVSNGVDVIFTQNDSCHKNSNY